MSTFTKKQVLDALVKARSLVAAGWIQGNFERVQNGKTCYCSTGANRVATTCLIVDSPHYYRVWDEADEYTKDSIMTLRDAVDGALSRGVPTEFRKWYETASNYYQDAASLVVNYNDATGRTTAEVLAMYDEAIKLQEERVRFDAVESGGPCHYGVCEI